MKALGLEEREQDFLFGRLMVMDCLAPCMNISQPSREVGAVILIQLTLDVVQSGEKRLVCALPEAHQGRYVRQATTRIENLNVIAVLSSHQVSDLEVAIALSVYSCSLAHGC